MAQKINDYYLKQWQKPIISFFDYLPIKYEATEKEWQIRQLIWDFKDGRRSGKVAELVARQIRAQFGSLCDTITFAVFLPVRRWRMLSVMRNLRKRCAV